MDEDTRWKRAGPQGSGGSIPLLTARFSEGDWHGRRHPFEAGWTEKSRGFDSRAFRHILGRPVGRAALSRDGVVWLATTRPKKWRVTGKDEDSAC